MCLHNHIAKENHYYLSYDFIFYYSSLIIIFFFYHYDRMEEEKNKSNSLFEFYSIESMKGYFIELFLDILRKNAMN